MFYFKFKSTQENILAGLLQFKKQNRFEKKYIES